ncbi:MarR family transcriptional regulator [Halioglobus maricola]|uniref:MarR family transcriptional regulator n=2 Tax=Halioglobus maricola TaxID=2601894 RepID=A0A5P9NRS6_9GAMM|nr:MarR family transcriptional regulator [Halioglobus maricola]
MREASVYGEAARAVWLKSAIVSKQLDNSLGAIHGIGLAEYMVLLNLASSPTQSLRRVDIADAISRTASAITRMLMPMEKIGLVEKESSARDARVSLVKITKAGLEVFEHASLTLNAKAEGVLGGLSRKQANDLVGLLAKV